MSSASPVPGEAGMALVRWRRVAIGSDDIGCEWVGEVGSVIKEGRKKEREKVGGGRKGRGGIV